MIFRINSLVLGLSVVALAVSACGRVDANGKEKLTSQSVGLSGSADLEEESTAALQDGLDSAAEALGGAVSVSLFLVPEQSVTREQHCAAGEDSVVVEFSGSRAFKNEKDRPRFTSSMDVSIEREWSNTWSHSEQILACDAGEQYLAIDRLDPVAMNGLKLEREFHRSMSVDSVKIHKMSEISKSHERLHSAEGTRSLAFSAQALADGNIEIAVVATSSAKRSALVKVDGVEKANFNRTITVSDASPLTIKSIRDAETGALSERTIESGKVVGSNDDNDNSLVLEFHNVKIEQSAGCIPVSGEISGTQTKEGEVTTFVITFDSTAEEPVKIAKNGEAAITFADADERLAGCALEDLE